ncbi:MAG: ATP-dependent helicase HrpB, partial [Paracoccaceae bacterium]
MNFPDLPIKDVLSALTKALRRGGVAVLQAPPGAGKTTVVPLAMLDANLTDRKILLLEPRRLAARAAAERMADTLGNSVGETVGYRIRGDAKISKSTRIEVVTEGILTRMIQSDPALSGVGAVIFDEFHERSLNADLGLALVWEARAALREDLLVVVMSATLDAAPIAKMLSCPIITSHGRNFPVETEWLKRPVPPQQRYEPAISDLVERAVEQTTGGVLVFLPGEGEIRRVEILLSRRLPKNCVIFPLFGAMNFKAQRAAIAPVSSGRKIVLATSIAETSLTIAGISTVVDGGLARRARFDPNSGMSRLVTERVTKAEAEQRRGRAGRTETGKCFRLWTQGQQGGLALFPPVEIDTGDLSSLVLDLALWGARSTDGMAFLTPPNAGGIAAATRLLQRLGGLDDQGAITAHGRALAAMPLHPRLAHMIAKGGNQAALLAALLGERDPLRGASVDLLLRREALTNPAGSAANRAGLDRIRHQSRQLIKYSKPGRTFSWAELTALAYPDRIGVRRDGDTPRWILTGGKEAVMPASDPLAGARLLVVSDLDGDARQARIRGAIEISE